MIFTIEFLRFTFVMMCICEFTGLQMCKFSVLFCMLYKTDLNSPCGLDSCKIPYVRKSNISRVV